MLEQEINKEIELINSLASGKLEVLPDHARAGYRKRMGYDIVLVERWIWKGTPNNGQYIQRYVNKLILESALEICITSPSEYIRECKRYFETENSNRLILIKWCYDSKMSKAS